MVNLGSLAGGLGGSALGDALKGAAEKAVESSGVLAGKAPEKLVNALKELLERAKKVDALAGNKTAQACIQKGEKLLEGDGKEATTEAVTKLTTELTELLKNAAGTAGTAKAAADTKKTTAGTSGTATAAARGTTAKAGTAAQGSSGTAVRTAAAAKSTASAKSFTDVQSGAFYYDAVQWAVENKIASGTTETTFSPDRPCTRAQTLIFLWRSEGSPAPKQQENPFTDVADSANCHDAVLWALDRGITSAPKDGKFNPDRTVTRAQVATFLYRNAGSPAVSGGKTFPDVPADAYYAKAVSWVAEKGITAGTKDGTFQPDADCTRGHIVTFLYRSRKK